jgi:adenylate cyclase
MNKSEKRINGTKLIRAFLEIEVLKSEKLRTTVLSTGFLFISLLWGIVILFSHERYRKFMGQQAPLFLLPAYFACVAVYFFFLRNIIMQYLQQKKPLSLYLRYFNAFIEVSIPTMVILIVAPYQDTVHVLMVPPILAYFVFIVLSSLTLNEWICRFAGLVAALEYTVICGYFLHFSDVSKSELFSMGWYGFFSRGLILFMGGLATGFITSQIKNQLLAAFKAQQEHDRIENIFGQHVSPEVVSKLLSEKANVSEYIPVCVMFLDIRNFTNFTEHNEPAVVVQYLNQLFDFMVEIIHGHQGIINKFLGDGFMAVFGAPISSEYDVSNAVQSALEIIKRAEEKVQKGALPQLEINIGLHFGYGITGTIGSTRRLEYTIVGDVVNSAAHIEQLNKVYNTKILISEDALQKLPQMNAEFVDTTTLKHRDQPMRLYKLM